MQSCHIRIGWWEVDGMMDYITCGRINFAEAVRAQEGKTSHWLVVSGLCIFLGAWCGDADSGSLEVVK